MSTSQTTDSASRESHWLRQAQAGDRAAYGRLVLATQDRLYNAMLRLLHNEDLAREVTQEAFLRGLANLGDFRGESQPYTWLFRIATNLAMTELRKQQTRKSMNVDPPDQAANLVQQRVDARERREVVEAALTRIGPEQRLLLIMRDIDDMEYAEMASVLELPLGTIKSRLFRARLALREELKSYFESS